MNADAHVQSFRILLMEHNEADVFLIRRAFKTSELNCELEVIDKGADAVAFFQNREIIPAVALI